MLRHAFEDEINELKQQLLKMSALAEAMLDRSIRALVDQDETLAREVIRDDDLVDEMDLLIEHRCMKLLALQQPMSRDLRVISTVLKVIADVERVGDYSVDIAKSALVLADRPLNGDLTRLRRMSGLVEEMLRMGLQALVHEDLELVNRVIAQDKDVDQLWRESLEAAVTCMESHPDVVRQRVHLLLVSRYLERIADHITNIAERVAFMTTGKFENLSPRHASVLQQEHGSSV